MFISGCHIRNKQNNERKVLVQILRTRCPKPIYHFIVCDEDLTNFVRIEGIPSMSRWWCDYLVDLDKMEYRRLRCFFWTWCSDHLLIYDHSLNFPVDTHDPSDKSVARQSNNCDEKLRLWEQRLGVRGLPSPNAMVAVSSRSQKAAEQAAKKKELERQKKETEESLLELKRKRKREEQSHNTTATNQHRQASHSTTSSSSSTQSTVAAAARVSSYATQMQMKSIKGESSSTSSYNRQKQGGGGSHRKDIDCWDGEYLAHDDHDQQRKDRYRQREDSPPDFELLDLRRKQRLLQEEIRTFELQQLADTKKNELAARQTREQSQRQIDDQRLYHSTQVTLELERNDYKQDQKRSRIQREREEAEIVFQSTRNNMLADNRTAEQLRDKRHFQDEAVYQRHESRANQMWEQDEISKNNQHRREMETMNTIRNTNFSSTFSSTFAQVATGQAAYPNYPLQPRQYQQQMMIQQHRRRPQQQQQQQYHHHHDHQRQPRQQRPSHPPTSTSPIQQRQRKEPVHEPLQRRDGEEDADDEDGSGYEYSDSAEFM